MSVARFVSAISWGSFIALTWVGVFNYLKEGWGVSLTLGLIIFLILGLLANFSSHVEGSAEGGDTDES